MPRARIPPPWTSQASKLARKAIHRRKVGKALDLASKDDLRRAAADAVASHPIRKV